MKSKSGSKSRLGLRFRRWFLLVLVLPIGFLLYFSTNSLTDRRSLMRQTIRENQLSQVLDIEEYFRVDFSSAHHTAIQKSFDRLDEVFRKLKLRHPKRSSINELSISLSKIFYSEIFPWLGFRIATKADALEIEKVAEILFCRLQVGQIGLDPDRLRSNRKLGLTKIRDIYDVMALIPHEGLRLGKKRDLPELQRNCAAREIPKSLESKCRDLAVREDLIDLQTKVKIKAGIFTEIQREFPPTAAEIRSIFRPLSRLKSPSSLENLQELRQWIAAYREKVYSLFSNLRDEYYKRRESSERKYSPDRSSKTQFQTQELASVPEFQKLKTLIAQTFSSSWLRGEGLKKYGKSPTSYMERLLDRGLQDEEWLLFGNSLDVFSFKLDRILNLRRFNPDFSFDLKDAFIDPKFLLDRVQSLSVSPDSDWELISKLLLHLVKFSIAGDLSLDARASLGATAMVRTQDLKQTRNQSLVMSAAHGEIRILWDLIPRSYQIEDFQAGLGSPPMALLCSVLKTHDLILHFVRLFQAIGHLKENEKTGIFEALEKAYYKNSSLSTDLIPAFSGAMPEIREVISGMSKRFGVTEEEGEVPSFLEFVLHEIGLRSQYPIDRKESWRKATRIELIPQKTMLRSSFFKEEDFVKNRLQSLIGPALTKDRLERWLENPQDVLTIEYKDSKGSKRIGTILNSSELRGFTFFLSLDSKIAYKENQYLILLLLLICSITILVSLLLGTRISSRIVLPVNSLSEEVKVYAAGANREPLKVQRSDEIGQMTHLYNSMVGRIDQRVAEMEAINQVNSLLLQGKKLEELMIHVVERFTTLTGARIGFVGFFEQDSTERLIASRLFIQQDQSDLNQDLLKDSFQILGASKMGEGGLLEEVTDEAEIGIEAGSVHFQSIRPAFQGLHEIQKVLEDFEPEKESENISEHRLQGFVILVDVERHLLVEEKLGFLKDFGNQAATVLLKAYLDQLREETMEGQTVQESLMPSEAPDGNGRLDVAFSFVAAKYLGGDFFDFLQFEDGAVGFFIPDVSGKGIGPALFGATCKAYLKLLSVSSKDTGSTLRNMNENLCKFQYEQLFATGFYMAINLQTMSARYSSAGHNRMILIRDQAQEIEYLSAKGLVLGMFFPCEYETRDLELSPGDLVVLYTDGVTEWENPELELYGNERFEALLLKWRHLETEKLKERILMELKEFGQGRALSDDVTLLLVKIKPEGLKNDQGEHVL